jgi:hypothetical protein
MSQQLVIFDLNGVLGRKVLGIDAAFRAAAHASGARLISCRSIMFLPRPGAVDVVRGLLAHNIDVAIWSTMREENVIEIGREMFGSVIFDKLAFVRGSADPASKKTIATLPEHRMRAYGSRVVIFDDTRDKICDNPAGSWFVVAPFDGDPASTDISWVHYAIRDMGDGGIRLPRSMSDRVTRFMCGEAYVQSKYAADAKATHTYAAASAAADSFVTSIL